METKIDKLISLSMQIGKFMMHQANVSFEERAATMLQAHVLSFLEKHPQAKSSEISHYLNASLSSTTQLIDRMYKAKLISRIGDPTDRRVIRHAITDEGKEKLKQLKEAKRNRMRKLFAKIDSRDLEDLIRIQEKIVKGLQEETKQ